MADSYYKGHPEKAVIDKNRLQNELRPDRFNGNLRNGMAIVMPFDTSILDGYTPSKYPPATPLAFLIAADMHITGRGVVGTFMRTVSYYGRSTDGPMHVTGIRRVLGPKHSLKEAAAAHDAAIAESTDSAIKVAGFALRHAYKAGGMTPR
jgi:hypothetical protein